MSADFTLNGSSVDLLESALSGVEISQCVMGRCSSTTCQNSGICIEDTNAPLGYYCRCSLGFAGENCGQGLCFIHLEFAFQVVFTYSLALPMVFLQSRYCRYRSYDAKDGSHFVCAIRTLIYRINVSSNVRAPVAQLVRASD